MDATLLDDKSSPTRRSDFWRLFTVLFAAGAFGVAAVMPYIFAFIEKLPPVPLPFPMPVLMLLQFVQTSIYVAVAVSVGLLAARRLGFGAPVTESWLAGDRDAARERARKMLPSSAAMGAGVALVLVLLFIFIFIPLNPQLRSILSPDIALWKRFLASFYGGIVEELLMRLFLFSSLVWLVSGSWRADRKAPGEVVLWSVNIFVALIFGLAHLPAAGLMNIPITTSLVVMALLLNGLAGATFGYLYWRRGLEAAMVAHFSADIVLHVIAPVVYGR